MAITNFTELQTAIGNWSDRTDLSARFPEFIALFEAKMLTRLRHFPRADFGAAGVTGDYDFTQPYNRILSVYLADGAGGVYNRTLQIITSDEYQDAMHSRSTAAGTPTKVFIDTNHPDWTNGDPVTLRFWPPVSASSPITIGVDYIKKATPLSGGQPSNEVLKAAPQAYLYGALAELTDYTQEPDAPWAAKAEAELAQLDAWAERQHFSGTTRRMKLPVVFG